jgi:hypothetical protein
MATIKNVRDGRQSGPITASYRLRQEGPLSHVRPSPTVKSICTLQPDGYDKVPTIDDIDAIQPARG